MLIVERYILCSTQAIRIGSNYVAITIACPRNTNLTEPFAIVFNRLFSTDCFVHADAKWAMSMVTNSPYETMLLGRTCP